MACVFIGKVPTYSKYMIDNRYAVYLHKCQNQNCVIDTMTDKDITATDKGLLLVIEAYNCKNPRR